MAYARSVYRLTFQAVIMLCIISLNIMMMIINSLLIFYFGTYVVVRVSHLSIYQFYAHIVLYIFLLFVTCVQGNII